MTTEDPLAMQRTRFAVHRAARRLIELLIADGLDPTVAHQYVSTALMQESVCIMAVCNAAEFSEEAGLALQGRLTDAMVGAQKRVVDEFMAEHHMKPVGEKAPGVVVMRPDADLN